MSAKLYIITNGVEGHRDHRPLNLVRHLKQSLLGVTETRDAFWWRTLHRAKALVEKSGWTVGSAQAMYFSATISHSWKWIVYRTDRVAPTLSWMNIQEKEKRRRNLTVRCSLAIQERRSLNFDIHYGQVWKSSKFAIYTGNWLGAIDAFICQNAVDVLRRKHSSHRHVLWSVSNTAALSTIFSNNFHKKKTACV